MSYGVSIQGMRDVSHGKFVVGTHITVVKLLREDGGKRMTFRERFRVPECVGNFMFGWYLFNNTLGWLFIAVGVFLAIIEQPTGEVWVAPILVLTGAVTILFERNIRNSWDLHNLVHALEDWDENVGVRGH